MKHHDAFPPPHPFEEDRVNALYDLGILDSAKEQNFEELTNLASSVFDVPICLVSLLDSDRQWFKSHPGLNCSSTCRNVAFCNLTQHPDADRVTVIHPLQDARFKDNPLVTGYPRIRFYAGAPLIVDKAKNLSVGSFCVIDTKERQNLTEKEKTQLIHFAALAVEMMKSRVTHLIHARKYVAKLASVVGHMLKNPMHILLNLTELTAPINGSGFQGSESIAIPSGHNGDLISEIGRQGDSVWSLVDNLVALKVDDPESRKRSQEVVIKNLAKHLNDSLYQFAVGFEPVKFSYRIDKSFREFQISAKLTPLYSFFKKCFLFVGDAAYSHENTEIRLELGEIAKSGNVVGKVFFNARKNLDVQRELEEVLLELDPKGSIGMNEATQLPYLWFSFNVLEIAKRTICYASNCSDLNSINRDVMDSSMSSAKYANLLIVACDDEPLSQLLLKGMLQKCGFKSSSIVIFSDGDEVLEYVLDRVKNNLPLPDIGCFDVIMERVNGDECLKRLREKNVNFPVVAATACENGKELLQCGFSRIVSKPYRWNTLKEAFESVI